MAIKTAIQELLKINNAVESELFWIFVKIMYEVEIQDTKSLLSPPLLETLTVKWRVKNPQGNFQTSYHYLAFGFENSRQFKEQEMALYQYQRRMPYDIFSEEFVNKDYTAKLDSDNRKFSRSHFYDMLKIFKSDIDYNVNDGVCKLERFPLTREINAATVATIIVTEAHRIFREQKKIGKKMPKTEEECQEIG
jgi:hypothetical protein